MCSVVDYWFLHYTPIPRAVYQYRTLSFSYISVTATVLVLSFTTTYECVCVWLSAFVAA